MYCNKCGANIADGSEYCPKCGEKSPGESLVCKHCGAPLEADSKFCGKCGLRTWLKGTEPTVTDANKATYTGERTGKSYIYSIISAILCFIIRLLLQEEFTSWDNVWNNRYLIGIDSDIKPFLTAIPVIGAIIASLMITSDSDTPGNRKATAFIVNAIFIGIAILCIWFDIPYRLFDY